MNIKREAEVRLGKERNKVYAPKFHSITTPEQFWIFPWTIELIKARPSLADSVVRFIHPNTWIED